MKIRTDRIGLFVLIVIIGVGLAFVVLKERKAEKQRQAERDRQLAIQVREDKQFSEDFDFVLDLLAERDMVIYKTISEVDGKIKKAVEKRILSSKEKSEYRRRREEWLLKTISEHEESSSHDFTMRIRLRYSNGVVPIRCLKL